MPSAHRAQSGHQRSSNLASGCGAGRNSGHMRVSKNRRTGVCSILSQTKQDYRSWGRAGKGSKGKMLRQTDCRVFTSVVEPPGDSTHHETGRSMMHIGLTNRSILILHSAAVTMNMPQNYLDHVGIDSQTKHAHADIVWTRG